MDKGQLRICACSVASTADPGGLVLPPEPQGKPRGPWLLAARTRPGPRLLLLGSYYKVMNVKDLLPPSVSSNHEGAPERWELGVSSFFLFLSAFFFSQIFMKSFSIYPDTSSPPWVSAGRAQTTNSRRYFPQSSIWLHWQVQRAACWELAEAEGGGARGRQLHSPRPGCSALGCPVDRVRTSGESRVRPLDSPQPV